MVIQNGLFVLVWSGRRRRPARRPYRRTQSSRCMTMLESPDIMVLGHRRDFGCDGVSHPKQKNQIKLPCQASDKLAERTESAQSTSGANLVYAGYPYDPYT